MKDVHTRETESKTEKKQRQTLEKAVLIFENMNNIES